MTKFTKNDIVSYIENGKVKKGIVDLIGKDGRISVHISHEYTPGGMMKKFFPPKDLKLVIPYNS